LTGRNKERYGKIRVFRAGKFGEGLDESRIKVYENIHEGKPPVV